MRQLMHWKDCLIMEANLPPVQLTGDQTWTTRVQYIKQKGLNNLITKQANGQSRQFSNDEQISSNFTNNVE